MLAVLAAFSALSQEHFNLSNTVRYAGRSIALQVTQLSMGVNPVPVQVADSGSASITGGKRQDYLPEAAPVPGVTAQELDAVTLGVGNESRSQASLTHLDARLGLHHVTALWVESEATAAAGIQLVAASGKSAVDALMVDGQPVAVTGAPNQTVTFADGRLVINEQSGASSPHFGSVTVNALHLTVIGSGSLIAASSTAEVINTSAPNSDP
jgi:hypothetical protein